MPMSYFPKWANINYQDFEHLGPGQELESEAVKKANSHKAKKASIWASFPFQPYGRNKNRVKVDPSMYDVLLGIANENHHWFLVAIYPTQKTSS
ncbi:hypothetical protein GJAV_G00142690 [Gymnothorax javanicus]|nr:hypothetical protein GJAV_G00142690 [Gymnothorax javanicus]